MLLPGKQIGLSGPTVHDKWPLFTRSVERQSIVIVNEARCHALTVVARLEWWQGSCIHVWMLMLVGEHARMAALHKEYSQWQSLAMVVRY